MKRHREQPRETIYYFITPDHVEEHRHVAFAAALKRSSSAHYVDFCANVASMMHAVIPQLRESLLAAFQKRYVHLQEIRVPSQAAEYTIDIVKDENMPLTWPTMLVYFGCCILFVFGCFYSGSSYETLMAAPIRAMRTRMGVDQDDDAQVPFSFSCAIDIRTVLGSSMELKEAIVNCLGVAATNSDLIGNLCKYLLGRVCSDIGKSPVDQIPVSPGRDLGVAGGFLSDSSLELDNLITHTKHCWEQRSKKIRDHLAAETTSLRNELDGLRRLRNEADDRAKVAEEALVRAHNDLTVARRQTDYAHHNADLMEKALFDLRFNVAQNVLRIVTRLGYPGGPEPSTHYELRSHQLVSGTRRLPVLE